MPSPNQLAAVLPGGLVPSLERGRRVYAVQSQTFEMGNLKDCLVFFFRSSLDLPRRASWSLMNFALARRCWGVWACAEQNGSDYVSFAGTTDMIWRSARGLCLAAAEKGSSDMGRDFEHVFCM